MQVLIFFFFCLNFFEGTKYSSYQWSLKWYKETETEARIIGVQTQMNKFNYFFRVKLAILLLRHSDNLSETLQSPKLCFSSSIYNSRNCYHLRKTTRRCLLFAILERNFNWVKTIRYWCARLRKKKESVPTNIWYSSLLPNLL